MITFKFNNNIINFLLFNIKFYLNIKYFLEYKLNIYINKFNFSKNIILKYLKSFKIKFNFRNKLNFNKSKYHIKKNIGKSRLGYKSSNVLKEGLIWFGLRNKKLKKYKLNKNLLYYCVMLKHNILSINNLEIIQFIYNITLNNLNFYKNINKNYKNCIFINYLNNYNKILNTNKNINLIF